MYYDILRAEQAQQNVMDITLITKLAYPYVRATFVPLRTCEERAETSRLGKVR